MSVEMERFGKLPDGREAALYTLRGTGGLTLVATNYGCRIVSIFVPDRTGKPVDVVLGCKDLAAYEESVKVFRDLNNVISTAEWKGEVKGHAKGLEEGLAKGLEEGHAKGLEDGKREREIEMARGMKAEGIPPATIQKISGLSIQEIENL